MKKYELIKQYPGSDHVGVVVSQKTPNGMYEGWEYNYYKRHVENNPEYWEEVVEKDYEIIKSCPIEGTIYSVKRLSDGEVFTVGDRAKVYEYGSIKTIDSMTLVTECSSMKEGIWLTYNSGSSHITHAIKQVKQPIFLTHDGKDIFEEDTVWYVNKENFYHDYIKAYPEVKFYSDINVHFLTREAAENYINKNKPLFTTEDGKDIFEGDKVWWVNKKTFCSDYFVPTPSVTFFPDLNAYFLTRQEAEDYIQKNKVLFTTEDGVEILYGNAVWWVINNNQIMRVVKWDGGNKCYESNKYFSTYEAAQYYVIVNAKVLSIEEFWEFVSKPGSNIVKQKQLKRLVKERLNLK